MRYAAPLAMPAGLGEWLGAELEARGVEASSLYARAVLSILLHSEAEVDLMERELDEQSFGMHPRDALELELRLERHTKDKEARRGRPCKKNTSSTVPASKSHQKIAGPGPRANITTSKRKNVQSEVLRRRPHSWNGDGEDLKKCAAIECLLSATDDDQWPVEKLVDELCTRLKILQLEQQSGSGGRKKMAGMGSSAPECFDGPSSDSDSFTSVSSPDVEPEDYYQAFPPLECLSDSDQGAEPAAESIWNVRPKVKSPAQATSVGKNRVPFVRMTGARLSPAPVQDQDVELTKATQLLASSCGDTSEAYFGDCSRDSSVERAPTPPSTVKGRLYERGLILGPHNKHLTNELDKALKSLARLHQEDRKVDVGDSKKWQDWSLQDSLSNIWAPLESDWALIKFEPHPWPTSESTVAESLSKQTEVTAKATSAVQMSLALLNHNPENSSFTPVLPVKSGPEVWPMNSKLMDWLVGSEEVDGENLDEKEIENILREETTENDPKLDAEDKEDEENLLTSPKTHFCPIQLQECDPEVKVKDGATFQVNAQPEEVHFLRSPSGALYLPESEENGDGWKGWAKYMVYKTPTSPSPVALESEAPSSRPASPFMLKFRVVQTEKCCQTDLAFAAAEADPDNGDDSSPPLAISSPFGGPFNQMSTRLLNVDSEVWKFDAQAVTLEGTKAANPAEESADEEHPDPADESDGKEDVDGLLNEVWNVTVVQEENCVPDEEPEAAKEDCDPDGWFPPPYAAAEAEEDANKDFEYDLDELWNPFMSDGGEDQVDVCEWIPQTYEDEMAAMEGVEGSAWNLDVGADSWPPPNIPIEYLDDEFFDEIFGSLDSKASEPVGSVGAAGKSNRRHCRRRRRASQKQVPAQRRRPCSFFVEGECRRADCKFSHDLASITCRFWIESSCFKGDACPFLHGLAAKEERDKGGASANKAARSGSRHHGHHSDLDLSEGCASAAEDVESRMPSRGSRKAAASKKKFQLDLDADFPSLSQVVDSIKNGSSGSILEGSKSGATHSRPIPIAGHFAAADNTGSSLENGAPHECAGVKRRRRKFPSQRVAANVNLVGTSSESSPGEMTPSAVMIHSTSSAVGKRSRKVAKVVTIGFQQPGSATAAISSNGCSSNQRREKIGAPPVTESSADPKAERRRSKSEHEGPVVVNQSNRGGSRLRLSSSYKEG